VQIVGIGFDEPSANQAWAATEGFDFELWSDTDKTLALYYGAAASSSTTYPSRVTKVLDADGKLVLEYQVSFIATHPQDVRDDCTLLFGG